MKQPQRKPKSRNEKIKFLKDLESGRVDLIEFTPVKITVWSWHSKERIYENYETEERLTEAEHDLYLKKHRIKETIKIGY